MADTLGTVQIPALATDSPLGDPLLGYLLPFWKQALTNALTNVWAVACPNVPVVKTIDARNPKDFTLTTTELPALFVDRIGTDPIVHAAADYYKVPTRLRVWWVLPRLELKFRRQRSNIVQAATAALMFATEWTARAPGYVVAGDTDPAAATKGSLIWSFAKIWSIDWMKGGPDKLVLDLGKEGKQSFDCVVWNLQLNERLSIDPTAHAVALTGMTDTVADDGLAILTLAAQLRVTAITPATGTRLGGTAVTIRGTEFVNGATVMIGGAAATSVVWLDAQTLTATTPAGTIGARDVVVTNPGGEAATLAGGFAYT